MNDQYQIIRDFESALCDYTCAPFCVTVTSCTMAILLSCAYWKQQDFLDVEDKHIPPVLIPNKTYIGVPMSIIHAGFRVIFYDYEWSGDYELTPLPVIDCARWLRGGMYQKGQMMCLSFHPTKHLGISTHGGAILTDNPAAALWLRRARFDGRSEGISPKHDTFTMIGYHCYMTPPTAREGLAKLAKLPKELEPLPNSDYPDLSKLEIFQ